jgi:hypothetical protein
MQPPFLGGGDQDLSQVVGEFLAEGAVVTPEELAEAFEYCEEPSQFAAVIERYSRDLLEDAIALQDSMPVRQQLRVWYEALVDSTASELPRCEKPTIEVSSATSEPNSDWKEIVKGYGELLISGFDHGIQTVKDLLEPWTWEERWQAILEFEKISPAKMEKLIAIAPNWLDWCQPDWCGG